MDRRAFVTGAAAVGTVTTLPAMASRPMREGKTTRTQLDTLMDDFIQAAKAIDPTIKGGWVGRGVDDDGLPFSICFEREGFPIFQRAKT